MAILPEYDEDGPSSNRNRVWLGKEILRSSWNSPLPTVVGYETARFSVDQWISRHVVQSRLRGWIADEWPLPVNHAAWREWRELNLKSPFKPINDGGLPVETLPWNLGVAVDPWTPTWIGIAVERAHTDWAITLLGTVERTDDIPDEMRELMDLLGVSHAWEYANPIFIQSGAVHAPAAQRTVKRLDRWYRKTVLGMPLTGRPRLEDDDLSNWRALTTKAIDLKRRYPQLTWETIARSHIGISLSQLKRWRQRLKDETAG